jgi:predicted HD phosphohydrolase
VTEWLFSDGVDLSVEVHEVTCTRLDMATAEDMATVFAIVRDTLFQPLPDRILAMLDAMKGEKVGWPVNRYEHSVQTASRALRDGARTDMVVAALLHDIGEALAPPNHSALAAAIVGPYVDEEAGWVVGHHGVFQQFHNGRAAGLDENARDRYRSSLHFDACAHFCAEWDQVSFDPHYDMLPIDTFIPMVREVFERRPRSLN